MQSKLGEVVSPSPSPRRVKVAVVGSGLAGLTAAYLLSTAHRRIDVQHKDGAVEYEVHVFEKVCVQGGHPVSFFWF
jgi:flavin-dependent dehydrogenase